ncbi:MAG: hypothetical protein MJ172_06655 [Clostridia bacterium]|nr:hypothetical protein [Clostridia bacterium]
MINVNDDIIVYAIYKGEACWYVSYKELWYLNYDMRIQEYQKRGYTIDINSVDCTRRDLLEMNDEQIPVFLERIKLDIWSRNELAEAYESDLDSSLFPSLYVDFDKKQMISMYSEYASYEDYVPDGWSSEFGDFLHLIPIKDVYWN